MVLLLNDEAAILKGWDAAWLYFVGTFIVALPVGAFFAFPAVAFGRWLPEPRQAWLIGIGVLVSIAAGLAINGIEGNSVIDLILVFGAIGALSAQIWWSLVERHRELDAAHD
ncbi:MAG: hypothetical protein EDM03_00755 [Porphyrobacter sp. IPPAS B-1204]|nr:MAG: hypothetical protein EDM03_00755 [Porphyrobacter sp. IPPAS B-1204]